MQTHSLVVQLEKHLPPEPVINFKKHSLTSLTTFIQQQYQQPWQQQQQTTITALHNNSKQHGYKFFNTNYIHNKNSMKIKTHSTKLLLQQTHTAQHTHFHINISIIIITVICFSKLLYDWNGLQTVVCLPISTILLMSNVQPFNLKLYGGDESP